MVRREDYIVKHIGVVRDRWLNIYDEARQKSAEVQNRNAQGAIFTCREEAVYGNRVGLSGECVIQIYAGPLKWWFFKEGDIFGIPDHALFAVDEPGLRADFPKTGMTQWGYPPFLDAKTNRAKHPINYLLVAATDNPLWIYIHCYIVDPVSQYDRYDEKDWLLNCPTVVMVGWCWGFEAQSKCLGDNPRMGENNHQISQYDKILRPMWKLRVFLDLCRQHGEERAIELWRQRGESYDRERFPRQERREVQEVPQDDDR